MSNQNNPLRILQVVTAMGVGGAENLIMNIYRNIDRRKIQFDFIVHTNDKYQYDEEILSLGGRIVARMPRFTGKNYVSYRRCWYDFFTNNKDYKVIHIHTRSIASIFIPIAKKNGLVTISHAHGTEFGKDFISKSKLLFVLPLRHRADYMFACSKLAGEYTYGKKRVASGEVRVINNAIDIQKYTFDRDVRRLYRAKLSLDDKIVIGHVGRFTYAKNHDFIVDVFNEVHKFNPKTILLLIGEGELRASIQEKVNSLGLKESVLFCGVIPNVHDYLQAMDIFLFPSRFEGLPVSLIEAQAAGLPCFISNNITPEIDITNLVSRLSLNANLETWANTILDSNSKRANNYEVIKMAGYDIGDLCKNLTEFYFKIS